MLGNGRSLQYLSSQSPHCSPGSRRRLPPTPGKALEVTPPSKPRRRNHQQYDVSSSGEVLKHDSVGDGSGGGDGDDGGLIDLGVRSRLKRIAAEVSSRHSGYEDRKPPPVLSITHVHTYIHTHACMHAYTHTYMHTYIHAHTHTYIHAHIHTYIHTLLMLFY